MATPTIFRPCLTRRTALNVSPAFPLAQVTSAKTAGFSTTAPLCKRKRKTNKDNNKNRGVSSIYRSGPREPLSMSSVPLPKPRDFKPKINVDEKHGLWDFFPGPGKLMWTPTEMEEHGRAWTWTMSGGGGCRATRHRLAAPERPSLFPAPSLPSQTYDSGNHRKSCSG